jgi:uncharacterized membrane protein
MLMNWFPTLPGWDGLHPAMVHFPIALLLVAPLLLFVSLFSRQGWQTWTRSALVVMALGTVAAWLAAGTGHAAGQLVDKVQDLESAIGRHEALGMMTRNLFTALTLVFAVLVVAAAKIPRPLPPALRIGVHAVFLVLYLGAATVLANAANLGGRLVHERGIRAMVETPKHHPIAAAGSVTREGPVAER